MATGAGTPAITNPRPNDWRGLQNAISAIIQRFQNDEALLAAANSTATATANSTTGNLNAILSALQILQIEVNALQNAQITDIESFVAGEAIAAGQVIVPLSANTVGVADPNDTARIFGVLGIATGPAAPAAAVLVQRSGVYTFTSAMGFQVGRAVYCDTLGGVTQTPSYDAVTIPLGVAVSANAVFVDPDSPALLQPTFSSGFENPFEDYLPATYALIKTLGSLESLIAALPYQSGADLLMEVPVLTDAGNAAVRVTVADIVALASSGGLTPIPAGDLLANLTGASAIPIGHPFSDVLAALSTQSSAERLSLVPVLIGGNAVMCTAEDIAALSAPITGLSGDGTATGPGVAVFTIGAGKVTYSKIQNVSASAVLLGAGATGGGASPSEIVLGPGLAMSGSVLSAPGSGGSIFGPFVSPPAAGWTWFNQGTNSVSNIPGGGLAFIAPPDGATTTNERGYTRPIPGSNFTATGYFVIGSTTAGFAQFGFIIRDSVSGKLQSFTLRLDSATFQFPYIASFRYTSTTVFATTSFQITSSSGGALPWAFGAFCWLRLIRNGTTLSFQTSTDGVNFFNMVANDTTNFVSSPTDVGIEAVCNRSAGSASVFGSLLSFTLTTP